MPIDALYKRISGVKMKLIFMLFFACANTAIAQQRAFDINAALQNLPNMESVVTCVVTTIEMEKRFREQNMNSESQTATVYKNAGLRITDEYYGRKLGSIDDIKYYTQIHLLNVQALPTDKVLFAYLICAEKINQSFR